MFNPMSVKLRNKLRRERLMECYNTTKKKHSRKSISWHKRRILARMTPKGNHGQEIQILQYVSEGMLPGKQSMLYICVMHKQKDVDHFTGLLRRFPVQEHHRIMQALRYLVAEGKLESDITTKEWDVQLALGVAEARKFTLKEK